MSTICVVLRSYIAPDNSGGEGISNVFLYEPCRRVTGGSDATNHAATVQEAAAYLLAIVLAIVLTVVFVTAIFARYGLPQQQQVRSSPNLRTHILDCQMH